MKAIKKWDLRCLSFNSTVKKENNKLLILKQRENVRIYIRQSFKLNDFCLIIELMILSTCFLSNDFESFEF